VWCVCAVCVVYECLCVVCVVGCVVCVCVCVNVSLCVRVCGVFVFVGESFCGFLCL